MTWATSVPILVFGGLSVLDLGPMYKTDRRQTVSSLNAPPIRGGGIIINHATIILSSSQLFVLNYHGKRGGGYVVWPVPGARAYACLCVCLSVYLSQKCVDGSGRIFPGP